MTSVLFLCSALSLSAGEWLGESPVFLDSATVQPSFTDSGSSHTNACSSWACEGCKSCGDGGWYSCGGMGCDICGLGHGCERGAWHRVPNMPPHYPYFAEPKTYYYFRPYSYLHVPQHQMEAIDWGLSPGMPYSNIIFKRIYQDFDTRAPVYRFSH